MQHFLYFALNKSIMKQIFTKPILKRVFTIVILTSIVLNTFSQITPPPCGDNSLQMVIKVNQNKRDRYKIAAVTNQLVGADTSLGSVRIFSWTSGGSPYTGRTLMQYDLTQIPRNAIVNNAKLYLYAKTTGTGEGVAGQPTYGTKNTSLVQKIATSWQRSSLSFNKAPSIDTTNQKILNQSTNTAEDYIVDLTDFAQKWVNKPDSNFGVLLRMQTENNPYNSMLFESGAASDTTRDLRLEICYTVPVESICPSNNSQLVITVDTMRGNLTTTGNRYKIAAITNNLLGSDTSLGSVRIFSWTSGGSPYTGRTLIQYNLKQIPSTAIVNSAKLYLYAKTTGDGEGVAGQPTYGSKNTSVVQKIITSWQTSSLSFNNAPSIDTTGQKVLAQSTNTAEDYVVDLTDFAQKWVNKPDSNFGVLLRMQTENNPYNSMLFESGAASDTTRDLRLEICYTVPLPIALVSFNGNVANDLVNLNWITNDANNASATIERSYDGINFSIAGSVIGKGGAGASNIHLQTNHLLQQKFTIV